VEVIDRDLDQRVLRQALVLLGGSRDLSAVPRIIDVMERSPEPYVVKKAAEALRSLTGERFRENKEAWRAWWEARVAAEEQKKH
jgi:hypothetical protein